ncbi:MAG: hypothetical protein WC495_02165 [Patescibacteria group bacterium]|jgi:predicted phage terminase large subunit-like protein
MEKNNIYQKVLEHPGVRIATARQSFEWFFCIYLNEFMKYKTAPFQIKMFEIAEDEHELLSVISAFRASAKTTLISLAYPIWAILGKQQKKFVVIISDTQELAKQRLANIRSQFENNALLQRELGPFRDDTSQWGAGSIVLLKYGARITVASREQSIRGITHNQHRPDLIILDDVENQECVRTQEMRDKIDRWFRNDIMPLGNPQTKMIVIGNLLHEDSLIMRLKKSIQSEGMSGGYYQFPVRIGNAILWPGKYPDINALERERKKLGDDRAWKMEYELVIVPEDNQIIFPEWIHCYQDTPMAPLRSNVFIATGIDLASSDSETANFTAMVSARVVIEENGHITFYLLPHPVNKRLLFPDQVDEIKGLCNSFQTDGVAHYLFIEQVSYQRALVDELKKQGYTVEGIVPQGSKRERLTYVSRYIRDKIVLFPDHGAEQLITQLVHFGIERYDDLADALSLLISSVMERKKELVPLPQIKIAKSSFYRISRDVIIDWADCEDQRMLHKLNPKPGAWQRLMG